MKKRLTIVLLTLFALFVMLLIGLLTPNIVQKRIVLAIVVLTITFLLIYIFGGVGKLVSSLIYSMVAALLLFFFPQYDTAIFVIATFLFALNPVEELEALVNERFPEERSIFNQIQGTYEPYYQYRKEVKNYYHLPQTRKLYTNNNYMIMRQGFSALLSMASIYLLVREINNLINLLKNFNIHLFFASTYIVITLFLLTILIYKKGFQSMLNFFVISVFPPIIYTIFLKVQPRYLSIITGVILVILALTVTIYQYIAYRSRIVYEHYHYYDNDRREEVYANALFEPFVYNEHFNLSVKYVLKTDINHFNNFFHQIIVYADYYKFFITAYTNNSKKIEIFTEFNEKSLARVDKFTSFLESLVEDKVDRVIIEDSNKTFYEENFFHKPDYIVARSIYLANILKHLEIKSNIVVSITAYFSNFDDLSKMSENYLVTRLPQYDMDDILTARIDIKVNNLSYAIEAKVRELLIDLLVNKGKYIRVSVYY